MHRHPSFIQKIDNDFAKISTPQQNIERSKLVETTTTNARFGKNMLIHCRFNHGRQHIFHKKKSTEKEIICLVRILKMHMQHLI
jgi:hypothetical protein